MTGGLSPIFFWRGVYRHPGEVLCMVCSSNPRAFQRTTLLDFVVFLKYKDGVPLVEECLDGPVRLCRHWYSLFHLKKSTCACVMFASIKQRAMVCTILNWRGSRSPLLGPLTRGAAVIIHSSCRKGRAAGSDICYFYFLIILIVRYFESWPCALRASCLRQARP